ncbi:hypothetical protein ACM9HF_20565 [Colwellia sp. RE-S-Sl-9]
MKFVSKYALVMVVGIALSALIVLPNQAHTMQAQQGTLDIVGNEVFIMLSLPVSAFKNIDDDRDGNLSQEEFDFHQQSIVNTIKKHITLSDTEGALALQELLIKPILGHSHGRKTEPALQLTLTGKFILKDIHSPLTFYIDLYGKYTKEKSFKITVTRKLDNTKQTFELTPQHSLQQL